MSLILLGILNSQAGAVASKYFLAFFDTANSYSITYKDANSIFVTGNQSSDFFIGEVDALGAEVSQFGLSGDTTNTGLASGLDSSDNLYILGHLNDGSARLKPAILKYNSSNVLQFQRNFLRDLSSATFANHLHVDSSGNTYFGLGRSAGIFGTAAVSRKINSSGSEQYSIEFRKSSGYAEFYDQGTDSGSNIYNFGRCTETTTDAYLVKTNSSGTVSFQKTYSSGTTTGSSARILTDSSGNSYLAIQRGAMVIIKVNSSGTIQWQKQLEVNRSIYAIEFDPAGDIVVSGTGIIFKIDTSGNLVWQRSLTRNGTNVLIRDTSFDADSDIYFAGSQFFGYIPGDGSLTGTYTMDGIDYVYAASTHTFSTPSFSEGTSSYSLDTGSPAQDNTSKSATSPSLTLTLENL